MPKHIWTVLAEKSNIDRNTNNVSLIDVIEEVRFAGPGPDSYKKENGKINVPLNMCITTLWSREDITKPETFSYRLKVKYPDNDEHIFPKLDIDLTSHKRNRSNLMFNGFPLKGPGLYTFIVELEIKKEGEIAYINVGEVPLDVIFEKGLDINKTHSTQQGQTNIKNEINT